MAGERALDLPQLDAEAAQLDLMVDAAEVLEVAGPAGGEPGPPCGRGARPARHEGIGDEPLGGQVRPPEIAAGEPGAADVDLAGNADRHRPQRRSSRWTARSGIGSPIAAAAAEVGRPHRPVGDVHGGLGDAVHVDQPRPFVAVAGEPGREAGRLQRLAAEDHPAQREVGSTAAEHAPPRPRGAGGRRTASD